MDKYLTKVFPTTTSMAISVMLRIMDYLYSVHPKVVSFDELSIKTGLGSDAINEFTKLLDDGQLIHVINNNPVEDSHSFILTGKSVNVYLKSAPKHEKLNNIRELLNLKFGDVWAYLTATDKDRIVGIVNRMETSGIKFTSAKELRDELNIPRSVCYVLLGLLQRADIIDSKTKVYSNPNEKGYFLTSNKVIEQYNKDHAEAINEPKIKLIARPKNEQSFSDLLNIVSVPKEPTPIEALATVIKAYDARLKALETDIPTTLADRNREINATLYKVATELNERVYRQYLDMESRLVKLERKVLSLAAGSSDKDIDIRDMVTRSVRMLLSEVMGEEGISSVRGHDFTNSISSDYQSIYGNKTKSEE